MQAFIPAAFAINWACICFELHSEATKGVVNYFVIVLFFKTILHFIKSKHSLNPQ